MQKSQIRWQCRRGMLELDLILLKFFDSGFEGLGQSDQQLFIELLKESDQTLYRWLMGQSQPEEPKFLGLLKIIRDHPWKM